MSILRRVSRFRIDEIDYPTFIGNTIIQSSLVVGSEIPRFCYHEKLSIAGNCRMCLLEFNYPRSLKPLASCALPIMSGMSIYTNTVLVKHSREGVLELLLLNHPLDCPVCDQGGECDLQDETARFGGDRGRFYESKRAVEDKECGPTIKTSMNRCIHCTKCVRFCHEICGEPVMGALGRGADMEIGTFVDEVIESELSGNLVDLCPVGALTSKPYAFRARPWELRTFETVDVIDSLGSKIRVDIRGTEIMRVLPSQAEDINEDWITDRTRFSYDGLKVQRLHSPMVRMQSNLVPVTWETAFLISSFFLRSFVRSLSFSETYLNVFLDRQNSIFGIFGDLTDSETMVSLSDFFKELGSNFLTFQENLPINIDFRSNYLLNLPINILEKSDLCVLVGVNLRLELPLLNLRIRKAFLQNNALVISFGFITNLTYQYFQQGGNLVSFFNFLNGRSYASKCLLDANFPIIFVGSSFLKNFSNMLSFEVFRSLLKYSNIYTSTGWVGISLVDSRIALNSCRDLGLESSSIFDNLNNSKGSFVYLCGVERVLNFYSCANFFHFVIFQGHSGSLNVAQADVVLPGSTFVEKESMYTTLEGRIQKTKFLLSSPVLARVDWKIIVGLKIFFFTHYSEESIFADRFSSLSGTKISEIRERLMQHCPSYKVPSVISSHKTHEFFYLFLQFVNPTMFRIVFYIYNFFFISSSKNFFFTNSITQNSKIMSLCASRFSNRQNNFWK